ncbi:Homocysteine S-methyltransferase [Violaceomyces palustris]|uniref:Homocysteine S-methyltransferase n=1 Tax=Violaceomyces palustris TaxID=1673888 RepID=A0ACD0NQ34_9BASI|nr:Homocysteine S-methyltransferase [Violaceomyces palustris]
MTRSISGGRELLNPQGISLLDGGLATYLEDGLGFNLSLSKLWSARLLDQDDNRADQEVELEGPKGIHTAHTHYLEAGARIIGTATYQASYPVFEKANYSKEKATELMLRAVRIASDANSEFASTTTSSSSFPSHSAKQPEAMVALSLGPYGAMLSDGSEYTGVYFDPNEEDRTEASTTRRKDVSIEKMEEFHYRNLVAYAEDPEVWASIGCLALETVPRLDEAVAFRRALRRLAKTFSDRGVQLERKPAYISFAFPDTLGLPWPPRSREKTSPSVNATATAPAISPEVDVGRLVNESEDDSKRADEEMKELLRQVLSVEVDDVGQDGQEKGLFWPIIGVGINCTKPYLIQPLTERMTRCLEALQASQGIITKRRGAGKVGPLGDGKPLLFLYPDGGLVWDGAEKVWRKPSTWADQLIKVAKAVMEVEVQGERGQQQQLSSVWKGCFVGGCCKSGTDEIRALKRSL